MRRQVAHRAVRVLTLVLDPSSSVKRTDFLRTDPLASMWSIVS